MRFLLLCLVLVAGCKTVSQPETFVLPTGETAECLRYEQEECGMALRECGTERSVDFECMSDVRYVGPSQAVKPAVDDRCKEALAKKDPKLIQEQKCYPPDYYVDPSDQEVTQ